MSEVPLYLYQGDERGGAVDRLLVRRGRHHLLVRRVERVH